MANRDIMKQGISDALHRLRTSRRNLLANGILALLIAGAFSPLFLYPTVGTLSAGALGLVAGVGGELLANWLQTFCERLRTQPPHDKEELLARLTKAVAHEVLTDPLQRQEAAQLLENLHLEEVVEGTLQGNQADMGWVLLTLRADMLEHRTDFRQTLGRVEGKLGIIGYRLGVIEQDVVEIRRLVRERGYAGRDELLSECISRVNAYTRVLIESLLSKQLVLFEDQVERELLKETEKWVKSGEHAFAVIVGEAGIGKTQMLCTLAWRLLQEKEYSILFLRGEDVGQEDYEQILLENFGYGEKGLTLEDVLKAIQAAGKSPVVFFDTLDLISFNHGTRNLRRLVMTLKKLGVALIAASRPQEFNEITEMVDKKFSLSPFSAEEAQQLYSCYNQRYYGIEYVLPLTASLSNIAKNPLHLRMVFEAYWPEPIPGDIELQRVYEKYWERKVERLREGSLPFLNLPQREQVRHEKRKLSLNIALTMLEDRRLCLHEGWVRRNLVAPTELATWAYRDLVGEGVLVTKDGMLVEFFHQTFWEFAASKAIIETRKEDEFCSQVEVPLYRGVAEQVLLQTRELGKQESFEQLTKTLATCGFLAKCVVVDAYCKIRDLTESDVALLTQLASADRLVLDHILGLIIYGSGRHAWEVLFRLLEEAALAGTVEIRRRICEAFPRLLDIDVDRTVQLMEILREDYDEDRWKADNRRRTVEALPALSKMRLEKAIELLAPRGGDEVYTTVAIIEAVHDLDELHGPKARAEQLIKDLLDHLRHQDEEEYATALFLWTLLGRIRVDPREALETCAQLVDTGTIMERICITRNLPRLLETFPVEVLELFKRLGDPSEHKNVRRPVAKAVPFFVGVLKRSDLYDHEAVEKAQEVLHVSAHDTDGIIRRAITDNLFDLIDAEPEMAKHLVVEHFIKDEDLYVRTRAAKALLRLINFFPEERDRFLDLLRERGW